MSPGRFVPLLFDTPVRLSSNMRSSVEHTLPPIYCITIIMMSLTANEINIYILIDDRIEESDNELMCCDAVICDE